MPEVYRTTGVVQEKTDTLVIHCSDPRFQPHFQEFLSNHLGLETYELLAVPGGPQCLTGSGYLPKFSWAGWRWVKFLVKLAKPSKAILITHDDCRWYIDNRFWQHTGDLKAGQLEDLKRVTMELKERFSGISVDTYFARIDGRNVVFESDVNPMTPAEARLAARR